MRSFYLIVFVLLFSGCKKEKVADYRSEYVGTYNFHYNKVTIIPSSPAAVYDTIDAVYTGSISRLDSFSLEIDWYNGTTRTFSISENGTLSNCPFVDAGIISSSEINIDYNQSNCPGTSNIQVLVKLTGTIQ